MSWLRRKTYKFGRVLGDVEAIASGDPSKMARRAKNRILGRLLGRGGFWRALWR